MKSKLYLEDILLRACARRNVNMIKSIIAKDQLVYVDDDLTKKLLDVGGREVLNLMREKDILRVNDNLVYSIIKACDDERILDSVNKEISVDESVEIAIKCDDFYLLNILSNAQDSDLCASIRYCISTGCYSCNSVINRLMVMNYNRMGSFNFDLIFKSDKEKLDMFCRITGENIVYDPTQNIVNQVILANCGYTLSTILGLGAKPVENTLTLVCINGCDNDVKRVIDAGGKPDNNTLTAACFNNGPSVFDIVTKLGAKPNNETLKWAYFSTTWDFIYTVTKLGAKPDHETLTWAVNTGNINIVRHAIRQGAIPDENTFKAISNSNQVIMDYFKSVNVKL